MTASCMEAIISCIVANKYLRSSGERNVTQIRTKISPWCMDSQAEETLDSEEIKHIALSYVWLRHQLVA